MKVLQLSARLPYPLTDGGAIGIYNLAKAISEAGNEVTFVSFPLDDPQLTMAAVESMSKFCSVRLVSRSLPSRAVVLLRTLFRGAYPIERRMMPEMFVLLKNLLDNEPFDVVHLDHSHVGKYGMWIKKNYPIPVVLRQHNFETLIYERYAETVRNPLKKLIAGIHARRLRVVETEILKNVDRVAAITIEDVEQMRLVAPSVHFEVIPAGVDMEYFAVSNSALEKANSILWVGGLDWEPNEDAFKYFLMDILPKIHGANPNATYTCIGQGTDSFSSSLPQSLKNERIRFLGKVPDIRPYLSEAAVLVVPLRVGGGMRLKLLEFFAAGKAVVSTSIGAEGNIARDGEEVILRDNPFDFASAVVDLLSNDTLRTKLGVSARCLVEQKYSWQHAGESLTSLYRSAIATRH